MEFIKQMKVLSIENGPQMQNNYHYLDNLTIGIEINIKPKKINLVFFNYSFQICQIMKSLLNTIQNLKLESYYQIISKLIEFLLGLIMQFKILKRFSMMEFFGIQLKNINGRMKHRKSIRDLKFINDI